MSLEGGSPEHGNFIRQIVQSDLANGVHTRIITRFPPEPNGYLHLGHAKSICLNFGLARDFGGQCHLRFDDTNPTKEEERYIQSIKEDVRWLGFDWGEHLYHTSDYFEQLYDMAIDLIQKGLAYVDEQTEEEVRVNRGDLVTPGTNSPFRDRPVEENLAIFEEMRAGKRPEGSCILRAKIDMASSNMHMRDPPIYRIRFHSHPRTGDKWCIYPIYDFAHGQSDSIEKITHSICTLEFEDHRPLYEWFQEKLDIYRTRQIEFARLNCTKTVMSKRKLVALVTEKVVDGWDDPRLPTIAAMRRRGYPPEALHDFCEKVGVAKRDNLISMELLETCVRAALHPIALRRNAVLRPLKVTISNYDSQASEEISCPNHPTDASLGGRMIKFGKVVYIDATDFTLQPPPGYFRLAPGAEVRLRNSYWIKYESYTTDAAGNVTEVFCTYDPETKHGSANMPKRKVKGVLHWVAECDSCDVEVRVYDNLFNVDEPDNVPEGKDWKDFLNKESYKVYKAKAESNLRDACHPYKTQGLYYQFERTGFAVADYSSTPSHPIFNLTMTLTDTWAGQTDEQSKEAKAKEANRIAREKAAEERRLRKLEKEKRRLEKEAQQKKLGHDGS